MLCQAALDLEAALAVADVLLEREAAKPPHVIEWTEAHSQAQRAFKKAREK